jgi:hypothetical protein
MNALKLKRLLERMWGRIVKHQKRLDKIELAIYNLTQQNK